LPSIKDDSIEFTINEKLFLHYLWISPESSYKYLFRETQLAEKLNSVNYSLTANRDLAWYYIITGDFLKALRHCQQTLNLANQSGSLLKRANAYDMLATFYAEEGDYKRSLQFESLALLDMESITVPISDTLFIHRYTQDTLRYYRGIFQGLSDSYEKLNTIDSAIRYATLLKAILLMEFNRGWSANEYVYGNIYSKVGKYSQALESYRNGIDLAFLDDNNIKDLMDNYNGIAKVFAAIHATDSAIFYANEIIKLSNHNHYASAILQALNTLANEYLQRGKSDSALKYLVLASVMKDTLYDRQKVIQLENMTFDEQQRQRDIESAKSEIKARIRFYALIAVLIVILTIAGILYRNNLARKKAFFLLQKQKAEINEQRDRAETTLRELKSTQSQLIQSEKMASLGELTAGIAHEIQNPLNFVNNFSDVNTELLKELNNEIDKGNFGEVKSIAMAIIDNEEKISHHGKRADNIVKGMLQHSRTSTGQKELTDINALADEYLRLSYHGLRAKDQTFNASIETDFDSNLGPINVVPQDIGRVLLNLYNNAFYATSEKKKMIGPQYEPIVSLRTNKSNGSVEIRVKDNGNGIPQKVLDKIFQPFFTTKPPGQGTGLGLSLSYDIIKAHGGEIKVNTKEGEGTEFIIGLSNR
jgi:signal transduction histidine kinase